MVQGPPRLSTPDEIIYTVRQHGKVEGIKLRPVFEKLFAEELGTAQITNDDVGESDDQEIPADGGPVNALALHFVSGRTLVVRPETDVPVYLEHRDSIGNVPANKLARGDLVVLVNDSVKKSLLQLAIGRVEKHPAMIEVVAYQRSWPRGRGIRLSSGSASSPGRDGEFDPLLWFGKIPPRTPRHCPREFQTVRRDLRL